MTGGTRSIRTHYELANVRELDRAWKSWHRVAARAQTNRHPKSWSRLDAELAVRKVENSILVPRQAKTTRSHRKP